MKVTFFAAVALSVAFSLQTISATAEGISPPSSGNQVEDGFTPLFNGTDLTGWNGVKELWSVQDGVITGQTTTEHPAKENTFLVWTNGDVADFELRAEFKLQPGDERHFANSGIQYRSEIVKQSYWVVAGYQADMEAGPTYTGQVYEEKGRGILCWPGQKVVINPQGKIQVVGTLGDRKNIQAGVKQGLWNEYVIIAKGNHIQQWVNGMPTADLTDEQAEKAAKKGILALQLHAGAPMKAQFRNIRIKKLD